MKLRPATEDDRDWLFNAYLDMLRYLDGQEYLILPTAENANFMVDDVFMPALRDGRGPLIAEAGGERVAVLFWISDLQMVDARYATATSYGQWVRPDYRGGGIVSKMIEAIIPRLKAAGIERVLDMVHTEAARDAAAQCGFEVQPNVVTLKL